MFKNEKCSKFYKFQKLAGKNRKTNENPKKPNRRKLQKKWQKKTRTHYIPLCTWPNMCSLRAAPMIGVTVSGESDSPPKACITICGTVRR
jgi:hypothetical protein